MAVGAGSTDCVFGSEYVAMAFKVIISSATADLGWGKKQADGETRDFETCRFSPRKTQAMTASKTRAFGRSSDLQAFLFKGFFMGSLFIGFLMTVASQLC